MKPTVYVETTIISYLVGWLNRNDLQVAAHQEITRRWWATRTDEFELFASTVVFDEASFGDPESPPSSRGSRSVELQAREWVNSSAGL